MDKNYEDLANAIVFYAVRDYQRALCRLRFNPNDKKARKLLEEVVEFFSSDTCTGLTEIDSSALIRIADKQIAKTGFCMEKLKQNY
jgi:hypothetical protein